jgi:hypothetical protein
MIFELPNENSLAGFTIKILLLNDVVGIIFHRHWGSKQFWVHKNNHFFKIKMFKMIHLFAVQAMIFERKD